MPYIKTVWSFAHVCLVADEKEKYDPAAFRDSIIAGLGECGGDLEQVSRFLDKEGSKLNYRRYAEALFDILFAGGILGKCLISRCVIW